MPKNQWMRVSEKTLLYEEVDHATRMDITDAKAWAKEQVRLMNEAEKEDAAKFNIELCAGTDLVMDEQRQFNGGYLFWIVNIFLDNFFKVIFPILYRCLITK